MILAFMKTDDQLNNDSMLCTSLIAKANINIEGKTLAHPRQSHPPLNLPHITALLHSRQHLLPSFFRASSSIKPSPQSQQAKDSPSTMPAPLIYLSAFPGTGKLTTAQHLQNLIPNSRILDNHSLIDPVEAHTPRSSPSHHSERQRYRRQRLREVAADSEVVYLFTDAQTEYNACVADYHALALPPWERRFYSIVLDCELEENVRRLTSTKRMGGAGKKLTDPEMLRGWREREGREIFRFGGEDELVVDVTDS